jgi:aspartyl-tRNA(Asn)/glutamyl-tRNA(Gln) amidotransferase subunit A
MLNSRRNFLKTSAAGAVAAAAAGSALAKSANIPTGPASAETVALPGAVLEQKMASGETSARALVERNLANIANPAGEGKRAFVKVNAEQARAAADAIDLQRKAGLPLGPLAGLTIGVKDLFDTKGDVTTDGTTVMAKNAPATADAAAIARLRKAGAIIIGRNNMVEAAYSGMGTNSHYGTPKNPYDRATGRIPGGSTSGGAVAVADGMAWAAIGSDTGGSARIPAALCGLAGFKSSQYRIPLDGAVPLSTTLDSVGPIGRNVADLILLDAVMAGEAETTLPAVPLKGTRFLLPTNYMLDGVTDEVRHCFERAVARIKALGATVVEMDLPLLNKAGTVNPKGTLAAVEGHNFHRKYLEGSPEQYDPRVLKRILPGGAIKGIDYAETLKNVAQFGRDMTAALAGFDGLISPTVVDIAPPIALVEQNEDEYYRFNGRMLRNCSVANLIDGCGISVPCHPAGQAPVGFMVTGVRGADRRILAIGLSLEQAFRG